MCSCTSWNESNVARAGVFSAREFLLHVNTSRGLAANLFFGFRVLGFINRWELAPGLPLPSGRRRLGFQEKVEARSPKHKTPLSLNSSLNLKPKSFEGSGREFGLLAARRS